MKKFLSFRSTASSTVRHILRHGKSCPCSFHARLPAQQNQVTHNHLSFEKPPTPKQHKLTTSGIIRPKYRQFSGIPPLNQAQNQLGDYAFEMATSNIRFLFLFVIETMD